MLKFVGFETNFFTVPFLMSEAMSICYFCTLRLGIGEDGGGEALNMKETGIIIT